MSCDIVLRNLTCVWHLICSSIYLLLPYTLHTCFECTSTYALRRTRDLCYANDYYYIVIWIYYVRRITHVLTSAGSVENVYIIQILGASVGSQITGSVEYWNADIWIKPTHFTSLSFIWKFNYSLTSNQ